MMQLDDLISAIEPMLSAQARGELFRRRRVRLLTSEGTPIPLAEGGRLFLHTIPLGTKEGADDWGQLVKKFQAHPSDVTDVWANELNVDGPGKYRGENGKVTAHVQYFRSGALEICRVFPARGRRETGEPYLYIDQIVDTVAALPENRLAWGGAGLMERLQRLAAGTGAGLAEQVERQAVMNMGAGPNAVDRFLHLTMPAIATLDRIRS